MLRLNKLYFMIGSSRSGKSTRAKQLQKETGAVIWNEDSLRLVMGNTFNSHLELMVDTITHYAVKALLKENSVILDDTHTTEKSIESVYIIDVDAIPVYVETDLNTCLDRAIQHEQKYLIKAIHRFHNNIEYLKNKYGTIEQACNAIRDNTVLKTNSFVKAVVGVDYARTF